MKTRARYLLVFGLILFAAAVLVVMTWAAPQAAPSAGGGAPAVVSYQGEVRVSNDPYTGTGHFKFAVVNAAGDTVYWSNDGTSGGEPSTAVQLAVSEGLFSVLLGDTLPGMTQPLSADVFSEPDRYLRVWFSSDNVNFDQLTPDTRIAAVPYALQAQEAVDADTVDGLHADQLGTHYQNVVVVAQGGGDYSSVQAAIDSVTGTADNPYLVWVAPGVYSETVTMKPYVHLQGAGQEATVISSTASYSGDWPPTQATLVLASDTSLRDLTVGNSGAGDSNTAILATVGMTRTLLADVTAQAQGGGTSNFAILLTGDGTGAILQGVTALAENGSGANIGLINHDHATAVLYDGNYTAREGTNARGILLITSTLEAHNVIALGENGSNLNTGLENYDHSTAVLYGGEYTGRGGNQTGGAGASHYSTITAIGITAVAENGTGDVGNYGMGCYDSSTATLSGGVFIARGGVNNYALSNEFNVTMVADNVTALAENGDNSNHGLWNVNNAKLVLRGASLTGRGGANAYGVYSANDGTMLEAESVTALGEDGSYENFGLYSSGQYSSDVVTTTLRNSSFTGYSGTFAYGIQISGTLTTLAAESVTALGEDGSDRNYGLAVSGTAAATLSGGSFTARGGITATYGILNYGSDATLEADSVTVLAENSITNNFGMYNFNGAKATLRGGSFTGRGGDSTRGIENAQNGSILLAENVTALAENGTGTVGNYGLGSYDHVTTIVRGGTFTARGGANNYGISNELTATLTAESVTALGENGSNFNFGLHSANSAMTTVRGGYFTGRGGVDAMGIGNFGDNTILDAASVTALGEDGSNFNFGLINGNADPITDATANVTQSVLEGATDSVLLDSGTVNISNSRLAGNPVSVVSGTATCVLVTRGTNISTDGSSCP